MVYAAEAGVFIAQQELKNNTTPKDIVLNGVKITFDSKVLEKNILLKITANGNYEVKKTITVTLDQTTLKIINYNDK